MSTVLIIALAVILLLLAFSDPQDPRGRHRVTVIRSSAVRMHLAEGTVDGTPLESGSRWILVRDGNRARTVST